MLYIYILSHHHWRWLNYDHHFFAVLWLIQKCPRPFVGGKSSPLCAPSISESKSVPTVQAPAACGVCSWNYDHFQWLIWGYMRDMWKKGWMFLALKVKIYGCLPCNRWGSHENGNFHGINGDVGLMANSLYIYNYIYIYMCVVEFRNSFFEITKTEIKRSC